MDMYLDLDVSIYLQSMLLESAVSLVKKLHTYACTAQQYVSQVWGVYGGEATPDPFPNSEVKLTCGNTSARVILCKPSSMPHFFRMPYFKRKLKLKALLLK
jgi:hypothetical protein